MESYEEYKKKKYSNTVADNKARQGRWQKTDKFVSYF